LTYYFDDLEVELQCHPRSKIMVPIDSPWVISYSTYIDPITISVTVFEIFDV